MKHPLADNQIRYKFLGHGASAASLQPGDNRLLLDVGNDLRPGVLDHHHLPGCLTSSTALVLEHPAFVRKALRRDPAIAGFTILLHREPDLDGVCAAFLASRLLTQGAFPPAAAALAQYVTRVDAGFPGFSHDRPFSLYAAYNLILHRLSLRRWRTEEDKWMQAVRQSRELFEHVLEEAASRHCPVEHVDALDCPGLFGEADREVLRADRRRYEAIFRTPRCHARVLRLSYPHQGGGKVEMDTLIVRHVQDPHDPRRCIFFKDWARTDSARSPGGKGFQALAVWSLEDVAQGRHRCIISVTPDSGGSLRGLGAQLEEAECAKRSQHTGTDDRLLDPDTGKCLPHRPGYTNPDPWYDGRAHALTIVDAPRSGTRLDASQVEDILTSFAEAAPAARRAKPSWDRMPARSVALAVETAKVGRAAPARVRKRPVVFISYAHANRDQVSRLVHRPLRALLGAEQVFFDEVHLRAGDAWTVQLADAVERCRVFLPLYSPAYFKSGFCEWELQCAWRRDPAGRRGIILPVILESVKRLPTFCAGLQAVQPPPSRFRPTVIEHVKARLGF